MRDGVIRNPLGVHAIIVSIRCVWKLARLFEGARGDFRYGPMTGEAILTEGHLGAPEGAAVRELVVIGGGRHARNCIGRLQDAGLKIVAVLDDARRGTVFGVPIIEPEAYAGPVRDAHITLGDPAARAAFVQRLQPRGFRWFTYRDRFASISPHAKIAPGGFIGPFNTLADVELGPQVSILSHCVLGAGVQIGAFTNVTPHATIASEVRIGEGCLIGMGARISAGVQIGDNCRIGINCVVKRDMPDGAIAASIANTRIMRPPFQGALRAE